MLSAVYENLYSPINMLRQFRLSVRLSVTHVLCIKTAECIIEILPPTDRPTILVFGHQGSLRKYEGVTHYPQRGRQIQGSRG